MISRNKLGDDFNEEILILKEDEIASGCYYFSVANFFSSFVLLTYFLLKTSVKREIELFNDKESSKELNIEKI